MNAQDSRRAAPFGSMFLNNNRVLNTHIFNLVWRRNKGKRAKESWNHLSSLIHTDLGTTSRTVHSGAVLPERRAPCFPPPSHLTARQAGQVHILQELQKEQMLISGDQ